MNARSLRLENLKQPPDEASELGKLVTAFLSFFFSSFFNEAHLLALRVQGRSGLIQEEDLGVSDDGPGDGDALLLAAGQLGALGADVCVVFLQQERILSTLKDLNVTVSQSPTPCSDSPDMPGSLNLFT